MCSRLFATQPAAFCNGRCSGSQQSDSCAARCTTPDDPLAVNLNAEIDDFAQVYEQVSLAWECEFVEVACFDKYEPPNFGADGSTTTAGFYRPRRADEADYYAWAGGCDTGCCKTATV